MSIRLILAVVELGCIGPCQFPLVLVSLGHHLVVFRSFSVLFKLQVLNEGLSGNVVILLNKLSLVPVHLFINGDSLVIVKFILSGLQILLGLVLLHLLKQVSLLLSSLLFLSGFFFVVLASEPDATGRLGFHLLWEVVGFSHI